MHVTPLREDHREGRAPHIVLPSGVAQTLANTTITGIHQRAMRDDIQFGLIQTNISGKLAHWVRKDHREGRAHHKGLPSGWHKR